MPRRIAHLIISGRVQGVGYRIWAARGAEGRALDGWVRNRADGTVEIMLAGEAKTVREMTQACWRGPSAASVIAVGELPDPPDPGRGFQVMPSER